MNKLINLMIVAAFCMTALVACGDKDSDTGSDTAEVVESTDTSDTTDTGDQAEDTGSAEDTGASEDAASDADASVVDVTVDAAETQEDSTEEETD